MSRPVRTPISKSALRAAGLVAALAAGGCGSSSATQSTSTTSTVAAKPGPAPAGHRPAAPKPAPTRHPPSAGATSTPTASINPPAAAAKPASRAKALVPVPVPIPVARAKLGAPRTWSGSGDMTLGTIALPRSVVVHWTASGHRFAVADASGKLAISGVAATGASFVASGTYSGVKVTASGRWTLSMASLGA